MTIKFRGRIFLLNKNDLKMANMFLHLANFAEARIIGSDDSEKPAILAKMAEYYNSAAKCLGFKNMKSLLKYQAKYGTDIVHGINERALE